MSDKVRVEAIRDDFAYFDNTPKSASHVRAGRHYWVTEEYAEQDCFRRAPDDTSSSDSLISDSSDSEAREEKRHHPTGQGARGPENASQSNTEQSVTCTGTKANGEPCTRTINPDEGNYCWQHGDAS